MASDFKVTVSSKPMPVPIPPEVPGWFRDYVASLEKWTADVERSLKAIEQRLRELDSG